MSKKIIVSLTVLIAIVFAFTICFADDFGNGVENAANGVRNFVGGVEDTVENAAMDVSNASKDATGDVENTMSGNENGNGMMGMTNGDNGDNGDYTATRTGTDEGTIMGMSSTAWTWLILGIAAIAIIAVVWYYSMQFTNNNHNNDAE